MIQFDEHMFQMGRSTGIPSLKLTAASFHLKMDGWKINFLLGFDLFFSGYTEQHVFPLQQCYGVFAQYRFRCVLGELGRFREGPGFREPVPGSEGGSRFRWVPTGSGVLTGSGLESACGFEGFGVPGFDGFLMGSDGFKGFGDFGFRWGSQGFREQELQKTRGTKFLPLAQCGGQCCAESECICVKRDC